MVKKIVCKILSILLCCGFLSNTVFASAGKNLASDGLNEATFEQLELRYSNNGELLKDVSIISGTYLYRVNEDGYSFALQVTPKDKFFATLFVDEKSYQLDGVIDGLYIRIENNSIAQLNDLEEYLLNEDRTGFTSQYAAQVVPNAVENVTAINVRAVPSEVVSMCNQIWGSVGTYEVAGGSRVYQGTSYDYSVNRTNTRTYGPIYRIIVDENVILSTYEFFKDFSTSCIMAAITVWVDVDGAIKALKDTLCQKMLVDNVGTKVVYINEQNSYWAGWDCTQQFLNGDKGWADEPNFSHDNMHPDYNDTNALVLRAIQNYLDS